MSATLKARLSSPKVRLGIKQFRAVIDFLTTMEEELARQGKTQADLARLLGTSRTWVSKLFSSKKRNLTLFTAVELADALGMKLEVRLSNGGSLASSAEGKEVIG